MTLVEFVTSTKYTF